MEFVSGSRFNIARGLVVALGASLLVLVSPIATESRADYISVNQGAITHNDRVCNLGDPNDHSTSATAFEISTSEQLWEITDCVTTSPGVEIYFELGDNIDVGDASKAGNAPTNSPIGSASAAINPFLGVFDGNNFEISGLSMSSSTQGVGLFAELGTSTFANLRLSGDFASTAQSQPSGALARTSTTELTLVSVSNQANVSGAGPAGGLIGFAANVLVESSQNSGSISGFDQVGGLIGRASNITINTSSNESTVSATSDLVGGLVGVAYSDVTIQASSNTGRVSGDNSVGGLLGRGNGDGVIFEFSNNTGTVFGQGNNVGGLGGFVYGYLDAISSWNIGSVSGTADLGGLVGYVDSDATITGSSNAANVTGSGSTIGGLLGYVYGDAVIRNSLNSGAISGSGNVGGLVGDVRFRADFSVSGNSGSIFASGDNLGGLIGIARRNSSLSNVVNSGAVNGVSQVGGFVGYLEGAYSLSVEDSRNSGQVSGSLRVGGFSGQVGSRFYVNNSGNTGVISGGDQTGGLAGYANGPMITNATNSGTVTGNEYIGGLIGRAYDVDVQSALNDGDITGAGFVGGHVGYAERYGTFLSAKNSGSISGSDEVGGIAGRILNNASFASSSNVGEVAGRLSVGGLLGRTRYNFTSYYSQNSGSIVASAADVGGLVGYVEDYATVHGSFNSGSVSGDDVEVGGLIGFTRLDSEIDFSYNSGSVSGQSSVGGLIGSSDNLRISSSFNAGTVSGSSEVGGLAGLIYSSTVITSSYNVGAVSAQATHAAGFVASASSTTLNQVYNHGAISAPQNEDGLVFASSATLVSAYTSVPSAHAVTTAAADMKRSSTYVGFDFSNVWGFATCNSGYELPLLRFFGVGTLSTNPDCSGSGGSSVAAPTYTGPMVTALSTTPVLGKPVVITGKKLSDVTQVILGETSLTISAVTDESMTIEMPEGLQPGSYDLVIYSGQGKLTVMNFITITGQQSAGSEYGELLGYRWTERFSANLRTLSAGQERSIEAALSLFEADTVICWAYTTALNPNDWALAHATARAKSACDYVAATKPGLKTAVRVKHGVPKSAAMRVSLQFWELKITN